nr:hypothetical protein [Polymorphobacter sp.]
MMKMRTLLIAIAVGIGLQVALVVTGHVIRVLQDPGFAIGGMLFSAVAGWLYARTAGGSWGEVLSGGAIAGGVCAAVGIAVSAALGDVPFSLLLFGTAASVATGAGGAALAKMLGRA